MIKKTIAYVLLSALLTSAARTGGQPSSTAPPSGPADGTILTEGTIATEGASAAISEESPVSRSALEWIPGDIRTGVCSWKSPLAIAGGPGIVPIPSKFGVVEPALTEEEGTAQEDKGSALWEGVASRRLRCWPSHGYSHMHSIPGSRDCCSGRCNCRCSGGPHVHRCR